MQVSKRGKGGEPQKGWIRWVFLGVIWLLIFSMSKDYLQTKKGFLRIKESENRLITVKKQNEELVKKLEYVSSPEHKEQLIREKLNMQRADEVVVILPDTRTTTIRQEDTQKIHTNWEKWLEVLRG